MFEGPAYYSEDQDILPEPDDTFDVVAEAERLRFEREREEQEKEARDIAHKEELAAKLKEMSDEVPVEKKRWFEIPEKPIKEKNDEEKPLEMNFTQGSEYIDKDLENGSEVVFDLNPEPKKEAERTELNDLADHIKAQAEILNQARAALSEVAPAKTIQIEEVANTESSLKDIATAEDEIRKRINESWSKSDQLTETVVPSNELVAHEVTEQTYEHTETEITPITPIEDETFANTEVQNPKEEVESEDIIEPQTIPESSETVSTPEIFENPVDSVPEIDPLTTIESDPVDNEERYESDVTPEWVRMVKTEVRAGRAPELRKWQKDILGVQYPELLHEYQSVLRESYPSRFELPAEANPHTFASQFDHMPDFMRINDQSQLPMPLDQGGEGSYAPYQPNIALSTWGKVRSSALSLLDIIPTSSLATIMVGGGILGAILIIVFGF